MNVKSYVLTVWNWLDPVYYSCTRLTRIGSRSNKNILRVRLITYRGPTVTLNDGTRLSKGDTMVKIHLHNVKLLKAILPVLNEVGKGKYIFSTVEASLPDLANYVRLHRKFRDIKAIIGVSMLNIGCRFLGFETFPIASRTYRAFKYATQFPLYLLSVSNPLRSIRKHSIKYLFMSKDSLLARYGHS